MSTDSAQPSDEVAVAAATTHSPFVRRLLYSPSFALFILMLLFVAVGATQSDSFLSGATWINILRDASFIAITAVFAAMVLIAGGLDLSVGAVYVAAAMFCADLMTKGWPIGLAILGGVLLGAVIGIINGVIVNYAKISPIIVTLATLFAVRSLVDAFTEGNTATVPPYFAALGQATVGPIPAVVFIALIVCVVAHVILSSTSLGWSIRAVGGNLNAAASVGLPVRRISVTVYAMCAGAAALAGVLQSMRLGSAPPNLGMGLELEVIAAAVIGGTSISGAIGTVPGAALGAGMLSLLNYGLILLHVDPNWQNFVIGLVLLAAAGLDQLRRRQLFRASVKDVEARPERPDAGSDSPPPAPA
ncbi:MAG: ABC transporter permease [Beutenbergiaceae bacterium]